MDGYRLSLFSDLSRFVTDSAINQHVTFDLGSNDCISCSGVILANSSAFLEDAVKRSDNLKLPGFTRNGAVDCVKLLYGGSVHITKDNFADIHKFGVFFKVSQFHDVCKNWVVEVDDVDALLLIAKVVLGNTELLNYCGETKLAEKDKMLQICWRNQFDTNPILRECRSKLVRDRNIPATVSLLLVDAATLPEILVRFLIGLDTLSFFMPVLQIWISSTARVSIMLECVGSLIDTQKREVIHHSEAITEVLDVMDRLDALPRETTQHIRKLEGSLMKLMMNQMIKRVNISPLPLHEALNSKVWRNYDKSQLLLLKETLRLPEHLYVEILLDWLMNTSPLLSDIPALWADVKTDRVAATQVTFLRQLITSKFKIELVEDNQQTRLFTMVGYKCKRDLAEKLSRGEFVHFSFPQTCDSLPRTHSFKLRLREDRDETTGMPYEIESLSEGRVVHCFITFQENISFWNFLEKPGRDPGTVYLSMFVNDFQDICSILKSCSKQLEVFVLLDEDW